MQAALSFARVRPASGPGIFSGAHRARAVRAADTGIILIVEFVVRHCVFVEIRPNLLRRPVGDWIHLDESEFRVRLNFVGAFSE